MTTITISESIRQEIAQRVVEQESAGYSMDAQGEYFVVDGERVMHRSRTAQWAPWHDDAEVIGVLDLVFFFGGAEEAQASFGLERDEANDADAVEAAVSFALDYVPANYDAAAWAARQDRF